MDPVVAAILGGVVSGAIVAAWSSFLTRSREHERWLREQRQKAYAEFVDELSAVHQLQQSIGDALRQHRTLTRADRRRLEDGDNRVTATLARLTVIASRSMLDRAETLRWRAWEMLDGIDRIGMSEPMGVEAENVSWWYLESEEVEAFATAARRELGAGRDLRHRIGAWWRWRKGEAMRRWRARREPHPEPSKETRSE